jgi:hypothetical protein
LASISRLGKANSSKEIFGRFSENRLGNCGLFRSICGHSGGVFGRRAADCCGQRVKSVRMLSKEIQDDVAGSAQALLPRWLRIPVAIKYSGLCRSHLYELIAKRKIKSVCLKSHKFNTRGVRLIDRESIDQLMLEGLIKEE